MNKIVSFGAIAVMGVAAQRVQNQRGPWGTQNRQTMFGGSLIAGNSFGGSQNWGSRGVPAPCGCRQACPTPVKTLPVKDCCAVPNPCDEEEEEKPRKTCTNVPEKVTRQDIDWDPNPVCSHIKLGWYTPWTSSSTTGSQASCEMPQMFQIRVKTAKGEWEDLAATSARSNRPSGSSFWRPGLPGIHYYRVSNPTLMSTPFELKENDLVQWKVRAWNSNGWGEWSNDMSSGSNKGYSNGLSVKTPNPPGGAVCINSWWIDNNCRTPSGKIIPARGGNATKAVCPKGEACVQRCPTISVRKPKLCKYQNVFQEQCCSVTNAPSACNCEEACATQ